MLRRSVNGVLVAATVIELASAAIIAIAGPTTWQIGPIPILLHSAEKSVVIAVVFAACALALAEPGWSSPRRAQALAVVRAAVYAALGIGFVALAAPHTAPGFTMGHDAAVHQAYTFLFDRALQQGQFPVRWVEHVDPGMSQPLFNYYQVGFYYLVTLLHAIGLPLTTAFKTVVLGQWAAGATFAYLLCRPSGEMPAAAAAALFMWAPYMLLDAYVRTAYPEFTAIGFAVAMMWAADRVLRSGRRRFVCALALFTALLIVCHMPTALIVAPAAAVYVLALAVTLRPPARHLLAAAAGSLIGAAIAAFYALPAIVELDAIRLRHLTTGYFDYHVHFVNPRSWFNWGWGYDGSALGGAAPMSVQIGIAQWIALIAGVCALLVPPLRRRLRVPPAVLSAALAVVGAAMFMMTRASAGVWEHAAPLSFIQFPWRLLMVPAIFCSIVAASALSIIHRPFLQALIVICAVAVQWHLTDNYREMARGRFREEVLIDDPAWPTTAEAKRLAFREPSYDPVSVTTELSATSNRWTVLDPVDTSSESAGAASRAVQVTPLVSDDAHLELRVVATRAAHVVVNTPSFPGWHVALDDQVVSPRVQEGTGYMVVSVPPGEHVLRARFGRDRVRMAGETISVLGVLALVGLVAHRRRRANHPSDAAGSLPFEPRGAALEEGFHRPLRHTWQWHIISDAIDPYLGDLPVAERSAMQASVRGRQAAPARRRD